MYITKGKKSDVPLERLCNPTKKFSMNVMVSTGITWLGATKLFFVNDRGLKENATNYVIPEERIIPRFKRRVSEKRLDICTRWGKLTHHQNDKLFSK